jgi:Zn-dependent oligopeptidase
MAVMTFAEKRDLRKLYIWLMQAEHQKNFQLKESWDNTKNIEEILKLRQTMAEF